MPSTHPPDDCQSENPYRAPKTRGGLRKARARRWRFGAVAAISLTYFLLAAVALPVGGSYRRTVTEIWLFGGLSGLAFAVAVLSPTIWLWNKLRR